MVHGRCAALARAMRSHLPLLLRICRLSLGLLAHLALALLKDLLAIADGLAHCRLKTCLCLIALASCRLCRLVPLCSE